MMHPIIGQFKQSGPLQGEAIREVKRPGQNEAPQLLKENCKPNVQQALIENRWLA